VIAIGKRLGYTFDAHDLAVASASFSEQSDSLGTASQTKRATYVNSAFYHYEFDMQQIPGFEEITRELNNLKIKPSTVNLIPSCEPM
jgi:hypothetical protein